MLYITFANHQVVFVHRLRTESPVFTSVNPCAKFIKFESRGDKNKMASLKWTLTLLFLQFNVCHPSWTIDVPSSVKGLLGSCVVIPCSYDFPDPGKELNKFTGMWLNDEYQRIVHTASSNVLPQYVNRTKLTGDLSQKKCSLEIDPLQQSDQGPFAFRIEIATYERYSYNNRKVSLTVLRNPDAIQMILNEAEANTQTASCSVLHSCPTHPPVLKWNHPGQTHLQTQTLDGGQYRATSTLTFHPTRADHKKTLQCSVHYHRGQCQIISKVLQVKYAPDIVEVKYQPTVKEGETVRMTCSSDANPAVSSYEWYDYKGVQVHTGQEFVLQNVSRHHSALYCVASNTEGRGISSTVHLSVLYAPVNVDIEHEPTVKEGAATRMTCSSDAHPPVSRYEWYDDEGAQLHTGQVFVLQNVSRHHSALYCVASNTEGRSQSSPVHLNVLYAPNFQANSSCLLEVTMTVMTCECIIDSNPPSTVQFVLADRVVPSTALQVRGSITTGTLEANLQLHTALITCLANNTQGATSHNIHIDYTMLILIIAIGVGLFFILLLILGAFINCRRRTRATPVPHLRPDSVDLAGVEKNYPNDQLYAMAAYNEPVYGNVQSTFNEPVYANMFD